VLHSRHFLVEFGLLVKLTLIRIYLKEAYSKVRVGKYLSD
jgi:hypothetical protein